MSFAPSARRFMILVIILLSPWTDAIAAKAPAKPFQRLAGCRYKAQEWNDGDSFHVTLRNGTENIFRLYFVDTPEAGTGYAARSKEQAAYFKISPEAASEVGRLASAYTQRALARPFTVQTRWRPALGRSKLPRYYAVVLTADGNDLAELLVRRGLARIYGTRTPLPDGRDSRAYLARLRTLEGKAKSARLGGWQKGR